MAYNISEVSGNFISTSGGDDPDGWEATVYLNDPSVTVVTGDFDQVAVGGGTSGDAPGSEYTFAAVSGSEWGTLTYNTDDGTFSFEIDRDAVLASGSGQTATFSVTGSVGQGTDTDTFTIRVLICVAEGTLVETPGGAVPVERLAPGDLVTTLSGRPAPLRWSGRHEVPAERQAADPMLRPVSIAPGALAPGVPGRALRVSPQHHVLVGGWEAEMLFGEAEVLAPAVGLLALPGISRDEGLEPVIYHHLLFDAHEVIFTEGAPTESFYPGPWSLAAIGEANVEDLTRSVPAAHSPEAYGPTARPTIRVWEAAAFARLRAEGGRDVA